MLPKTGWPGGRSFYFYLVARANDVMVRLNHIPYIAAWQDLVLHAPSFLAKITYFHRTTKNVKEETEKLISHTPNHQHQSSKGELRKKFSFVPLLISSLLQGPKGCGEGETPFSAPLTRGRAQQEVPVPTPT